MPRYVAFLRGVSPMNAKMPDLKQCFEEAGFTNVKTVLSSGNVVFDSRAQTEKSLEKKIEKALEKQLGHKFETIVRSTSLLQQILDEDAFQEFRLSPKSKRVITFLKDSPEKKILLPITKENATILKHSDKEVYSAYVPGPKGPVFMNLIEKIFGKNVTTRTWETVKKVTRA